MFRLIKLQLVAVIACSTLTSVGFAGSTAGSVGILNDWWRYPTVFVRRDKLDARLPKLDALVTKLSRKRLHRHFVKHCGSSQLSMLPKVNSWRQRGIAYHIATFKLARAMTILLWVGGDGQTRVKIDGKTVVNVVKPHRGIADDQIVRLHLVSGRHRLEVRSIWSRMWWRRIPRFYIRFSAADTLPLKGISLASPRCGTRNDYRLKLDIVATPQGLRLNATPSRIGIIRRPQSATSLRLARQSTRVRAKAIPGGGLAIELHGRGDYQLALDLIASDGSRLTTFRRLVRPRPALNRVALQGLNFAPASNLRSGTFETIRFMAQRLLGLLVQQDNDSAYLQRFASRLSNALSHLKRGIDPFAKWRGHFLRAYRSKFDQSLQYYSIVVPKSYQKTAAIPLIVSLHGQGAYPQLNVRRLFGLFPKKGASYLAATRHLPKFPTINAIVVAPNVYRNTGTRYFGSNDVLRIVKEIKSLYSIDPDRIYLTGLSMGGLGTFHLGLRRPDVWAALATMAGYASVKLYRELRGVTLAPWELPLIEEREDTNYAMNGRHLPLFSMHGSRDDPYHSESMVKAFKNLGYRASFHSPVWGHNVWRIGYKNMKIIGWFKRKRRPRRPSQVDLASYSYRVRRSFWLQIDEFANELRRGELRGRLRGKTLRIRTKNILALTILRRHRPKTAVYVEINGKRIGKLLPTDTSFRRIGSLWTLGPIGYRPGQKRPGLAGPIPDVRFEPHLFVYGTRGVVMRRMSEKRARFDARYSQILAKVSMPVKADHQLTADDIATKHLIVYGNPQSNSILANVHKRLPIRFTATSITLAGHQYKGKDVGVALIYPNPLNPRKYIVVIGAVGWRGLHYSRYLPRWTPDIVIFDRRLSRQYGGKVMHRRGVLAAGFFDKFWKIDTRLLTLNGWNLSTKN